ncbi:MAG TPA: glutathione S-transferase family protein [Burkholderiaceae bacterium]|jgi:glutathione S-transferase|nr:glutathione S-transferase family protein [Burkholderiaceae bacterium]
MYTLYIANKNYSSWSLRPWILMRELSIAFTERVMPFSEGPNWPAFREFAPNGKVPCLHDQGEKIWDSLAIIEYLAERHVNVWPTDTKARTWARCAAAEMHSGFGALRTHCTMNCGIRVHLNDVPATLKSEITRLNELWNEGLTRFGGPFLAGKTFTAVDAMFAPVIFRAQTYGIPLEGKAASYAEHMLNQPAMRAWYDEALKESWREADHEAEAKAAGTWTADLRMK